MRPYKYNPDFNSGSFRHHVTFLKEVITTDKIGQETVEWIEYKKVWAIIKTVKGSEYVAAGAERAEIIYRFIIRYITGVTSDMKIKYKNRMFDIIEPPINDNEMNKTLTILAKERV